MTSLTKHAVVRAEQISDPWFQVLWTALTREERQRIGSLPSAAEELIDDLSLQLDLDPVALTMRVCLLRDWRFEFQPLSQPVQRISTASVVSLSGPPAYLTSNPFDPVFQEFLDGTPWYLAPLSKLRMISDAQAISPASVPTTATAMPVIAAPNTTKDCATANAEFSHSVLVVDDDKMFADVLRRYLNREGYEAHCVTSLERAQHFLSARNPKIDLIICDVHLSGDESAFESSSIVEDAARQGDRGALPVIMLTSDTSTETKVRYLRSGAKILLNKQCDPRLITAYVRRFTRPTFGASMSIQSVKK